MSTVFVGGSRRVSRLPLEVKKRLDNVVASGHWAIVGDANGADRAVQKHFVEARYDKVTVFCSGRTPRNNLGSWEIYQVDAPKDAKGFQFYAAKDREMARNADFGLMIWDGKSPGTILNVLRLVRAGKISVLFNVHQKAAVNIKSAEQWETFIAQCSAQLRTDLEKRATQEEWIGDRTDAQRSLLGPEGEQDGQQTVAPTPMMIEKAVFVLNTALASGDAATVMDTLGGIARERGMSQVARDTGLARESLYRSLDGSGNPEFATVLKVLTSIGLRLEAKARASVGARAVQALPSK